MKQTDFDKLTEIHTNYINGNLTSFFKSVRAMSKLDLMVFIRNFANNDSVLYTRIENHLLNS